MNVAFALLIPLLILILIVLGAIVRVVREYERGVVFRLGRLVGPRGPGLILLVPFIERMQRIDLRTVTLDIPAQEVITRDNVTVRVNAVAYFRVVDPNAAIVNVTDYNRATSQIAQTTLRSVLGQFNLDDLLSERETINERLQQIIDEQTEPWGVKVSIVEVKDIELPQSMQRAMAQQAEAEREKRAKIIRAEGEFQASQQLSNAARVISENPIALQLRYLQTVSEIGTENSTSIVFPIPIDMLNGLIGGFTGNGSSSGNAGSSTSPSPSTPTITVLEPRPGPDEPRS
ncbi:MAG: slipin family protein [Thermomicrobiales bacterium]|jgi:regulator of protease activity HflC (stomatin/prohibitin superfamily)